MKYSDQNIYNLGEEKFSLILKCLLDRIPILIAGTNKENVEFFADNLADLMSFRQKLIFYTDFISKNEFSIILENEESNYEVERSIILCPNEAAHKALQLFNNFNSWILCFQNDDNSSNNKFETKLSFIVNLMQKKTDYFLLIENKPDNFNVNLIGKKNKFFDFKFEKLIYNKAIKFVDNSINKMRRIFSQRLSSSNNLESEIRNELLNFNYEENILKNNFFKIKILEFYNAARRAFSLLNKISILNSIDINIDLNNQTIMNSISYSDATYERLIEFIKSEWNETFDNNIQLQQERYKDDLIESLWG